MVQLSQPYRTIGKTIAMTIWTYVGKVISLLFDMWSKFVIALLPRSKHLLIAWLQSPSALILEPKKIKFVTAFSFSPSIFHLVQFSSVQLLSRVPLFATPWTVAYQAPWSMGFSKQEYRSGLPFPSLGDLPDPGIEPGSPAL